MKVHKTHMFCTSIQHQNGAFLIMYIRPNQPLYTSDRTDPAAGLAERGSPSLRWSLGPSLWPWGEKHKMSEMGESHRKEDKSDRWFRQSRGWVIKTRQWGFRVERWVQEESVEVLWNLKTQIYSPSPLKQMNPNSFSKVKNGPFWTDFMFATALMELTTDKDECYLKNKFTV